MHQGFFAQTRGLLRDRAQREKAARRRPFRFHITTLCESYHASARCWAGLGLFAWRGVILPPIRQSIHSHLSHARKRDGANLDKGIRLLVGIFIHNIYVDDVVAINPFNSVPDWWRRPTSTVINSGHGNDVTS